MDYDLRLVALADGLAPVLKICRELQPLNLLELAVNEVLNSTENDTALFAVQRLIFL